MRESALFRKFFVGATAALLFVLPCFAEFDFYSIPDSAEIRKSIEDTWLTAPVSQVMDNPAFVTKNSYGTSFEVRWEETESELQIIVAPESYLDVNVLRDGAASPRKERRIVYPKNAPGSWVLTRDKATGKKLKICYYFNKNADVFIQFREDEKKTYADMMVFDSFVCRSIPVGIKFDRLYAASFSDIYRYTAKTVPWNYVNATLRQYHPSLQMINVIRDLQKNFKYIDDVCYDDNGIPVYITSGETVKDGFDKPLDSSRIYFGNAGFIKWIIDGIVEPITAQNISLSEITVPTVTYDDLGKNGVLSQKWNLSFALDWTRNLAARCLSMRNSREYTYKTGGVDVTIEPFVFYKDGDSVKSSTGYIEDTGYQVRDLKSLLYVLGVTEPSWFYIAAIRESSEVSHEDMTFNKCAVFFPYFDDDGFFECSVFENGQELSLDEFIKKYGTKNTFVHLERVRATDDFYPKTVN